MEIQEIKEELKDSLQKILAYADCDKKLEEAFVKSLTSYKRLSQKSSSDDAARILRHELTGLFYKLYEKVFGTFVKTGKLPVVIRMFLEFGYVDEKCSLSLSACRTASDESGRGRIFSVPMAGSGLCRQEGAKPE